MIVTDGNSTGNKLIYAVYTISEQNLKNIYDINLPETELLNGFMHVISMLLGGTLRVTVIDAENKIGDPSSNTRRSCLCFISL